MISMVLELNSAVLTFGLAGFVSAIVAFTTLRGDVKALALQVARLDSDRDTIIRHDVDIETLKVEVQRLAGREAHR